MPADNKLYQEYDHRDRQHRDFYTAGAMSPLPTMAAIER